VSAVFAVVLLGLSRSSWFSTTPGSGVHATQLFSPFWATWYGVASPSPRDHGGGELVDLASLTNCNGALSMTTMSKASFNFTITSSKLS
jgi:hypothetical protein